MAFARGIPRLTVHSGTELMLGAAAVGAASLAFTPFYTGLDWLVPVLGAVLLGTAFALAATTLGWPTWILAPAALLTLAAYDLLALHGLPTAQNLRSTGEDLLSGWARALSIALPANARADLLAFPVAVALIAACTTGLLVLRAATTIGICAPPIAVLLIALALTAQRNTPPMIPTTAALLAVLLALILVRANRPATTGTPDAARAIGIDLAAQGRHSTTGRVLFGLPGALAIIALATAGTLTLPLATGTHRADPRTLVQPDIILATELSPLVELKPQLLDTKKPQALYRVRVEGRNSALVDRIRLAALDHFDGALWSESGRLVLAGTDLPQATAPPARSSTVSLDIQVLTGRSAFLPVVGQPVRVQGTEVAIEEESGTLIRPPTSRGSTEDVTYHLTAQVTRMTKEIGDAVPPKESPRRLTALPDAPAWIAVYANNTLAEATKASGHQLTPWAQLLSLQKYLQDRNHYNPAARPGHSYYAVYRSVAQAEPESAYAEQYASAFAILARSMGYPTRVAVGYVLNPKHRNGAEFSVYTTDVHAWPEVLLDGYGWVDFEPTNPAKVGGLPRESEAPPLDVSIAQVPKFDESVGAEGGDGAGTLVRVARGSAYVVVALVLAGLAAIGGIALAKVVRRARRRRAGPPASRIGGAWRETTDRLRELGYPVARYRTPAEIVRDAATGPASATAYELTELAVIVTASVYAPGEPTSAASRRAWRREGEIRRHLREGVPLARRVLAWIDPRPLLVRWLRTRRRPAAPVPSVTADSASETVGSGVPQ